MLCESAQPHACHTGETAYCHFTPPLALLSMDPMPSLGQDSKQEICCWAPFKNIASTSGLTGTAESASACQRRHPAASVPCQRLTFEQRAAVPDVMSLVICAEFLVSLSEQKVLALSSVAVKLSGMSAADALHSQWSVPVRILLVFHCSLSCRLLV